MEDMVMVEVVMVKDEIIPAEEMVADITNRMDMEMSPATKKDILVPFIRWMLIIMIIRIMLKLQLKLLLSHITWNTQEIMLP
jgi:hypothetical protein